MGRRACAETPHGHSREVPAAPAGLSCSWSCASGGRAGEGGRGCARFTLPPLHGPLLLPPLCSVDRRLEPGAMPYAHATMREQAR